MNCIVCNEPISKKARTCSAKCRQIASRQRSVTSSVTPVTVTKCDKASVTDLELCRYCTKPLPALAKPRRWPGACNDCAVRQPRKPSMETLGELVYAGSEYVPPSKSEPRSTVIWESEPGAAKAIDERLTD